MFQPFGMVEINSIQTQISGVTFPQSPHSEVDKGPGWFENNEVQSFGVVVAGREHISASLNSIQGNVTLVEASNKSESTRLSRFR